MEYTIDAQGKKLGRVATEAASLLMGKNTTDFARNRAPKVKVTIENAATLDISYKKNRSKTYVRHTGYPGGLRTRTLEELQGVHGIEEAVRTAVRGMLPKNKLQDVFMKNLIVTK